MLKNRYLLVLGVISLLLVTMAVARPYSNAKSLDLSKPASPRIIPLYRISNLPDYFQRHPELRASASNTKLVDLSQPARPMIIPLYRITNLPDYFQRHPELRVSAAAGMVVDIAGDFYLRHTDWIANVGIPVTGRSEAEDYFMRHPALNSSSAPVDLSDYFLRH